MASDEVIFEVVGVLLEDVNTSLEYMIDEEKTQFWRRAHVRSMFALIEGWVFSMKYLILEHVAAAAVTLPDGDIALLREDSYELAKNGVLQVKPKFIPLEKNIKFVFRCLATTLKSGFALDTSAVGWNTFMAALAMRNRITHPRSTAQLELTDDEMSTVEEAMAWFRTVSIEVIAKRGTVA